MPLDVKWFFFLIVIVFVSCGQEKEQPEVYDILEDYIKENAEFPLVRDSLIACAAGAEGSVLVNDTAFPISVLFYPMDGASDFLYFESDKVDIDPDDLTQYQLQDLEDEPILNGYLRKFRREAANENVWGFVTYFRNGEIHISNPIRLKYSDKPTENNADLLICNFDEPTMPSFAWQDGSIDENAIYFQVIAEAVDESLISGTYTFDRSFQFYDLSNVVLNIRDIQPAPVLESGKDYVFIMMAVSEDNWVNLVMRKEFTVQ